MKPKFTIKILISARRRHSLSLSLRSEAPGRLTLTVRQYDPLKPFECIPAQS
jgi:hypothetical protein